MKSIFALATLALSSTAFASSLECETSKASIAIEGSKMVVALAVEGKTLSGVLTSAGTLGGYDSSDAVALYRNGSLTAQVAGTEVTIFQGNDIVATVDCK